MIKKFKQYNEGIKSLLIGPEKEILDNIIKKKEENGYKSLTNTEKEVIDNIDNGKYVDILQKHNDNIKSATTVVKDLGLFTYDEELSMNLGRYIKFKNDKDIGIIANNCIFELIGTQKHWGHNKEGKYVFGIIGYRAVVVGVKNDFGTVAAVGEFNFVDMTKEEAININKKIFKNIEND